MSHVANVGMTVVLSRSIELAQQQTPKKGNEEPRFRSIVETG
jgi:hypothetical protein